MSQAELDSFVYKLKSLWKMGLSAKLQVETNGGKVSVCLEADLGYAPPPTSHQKSPPLGRNRGPAYRRRQELRRSQRLNVPTVSSEEVTVAADHTKPIQSEVTEEVTVVHEEDIFNKSTANVLLPEDSEAKLKELRSKIVKLEEELEMKTNTIAVYDMLFEDFKERVKIKYLYDSNDEERDYEPNEERRELLRLKFWQKKLQERRIRVGEAQKKKEIIGCKEFDFTAKN